MAKQSVKQAHTAAVIYLRVSSDGQAASGLGREAQEAACRALAARQGWPVASVHVDDGLSGALPIERRPGLLAAVQACREHGASAFVVYSVSRAARSVPELYRLVDPHGPHGVPLVSVSEPIDMSTAAGRMMLGVLAAFAAFESDLASERTVAALSAARARGTKLGAPKLLATPAMASALARAHELRASGLSLRDVVARLNEEGVRAAKGGVWHEKTLRAALAVEPAPRPIA